MSAIFPPPAQGGVPGGTPGLCNAYAPTPSTMVGGGPYWIAPDCSTLLTDCQVNGITSEILAAVDILGCQFQYTRIDNLGRCLNAKFQALQDLIDSINVNLGIFVQPNPPANPQVGWLWWDTINGQLFVWYSDPNSSQWVIANALEKPEEVGVVFIGPAPPPNPLVGGLWWRNTDGQLLVYYDDGNSRQWVIANNQEDSGSGGIDLSEYATRTWVLQQIALGGTFVDAPADGEIYARQDNSWVVVSGGLAEVDGGTW